MLDCLLARQDDACPVCGISLHDADCSHCQRMSLPRFFNVIFFLEWAEEVMENFQMIEVHRYSLVGGHTMENDEQNCCLKG